MAPCFILIELIITVNGLRIFMILFNMPIIIDWPTRTQRNSILIAFIYIILCAFTDRIARLFDIKRVMISKRLNRDA